MSRANININHQNVHGQSALIKAVISGNIDTVLVLLQVPNIDINLRDNEGRTALIHASILGYSDIFRVLLQKEDIDINILDNNGESALIHALKGASGNLYVIRDNAERNQQESR